MRSDQPEHDYELLLSAKEESGLYELVWSISGRREDLRIGDTYRIADDLVRFHLKAGNIRLMRRFFEQSHYDEPILESEYDVTLKNATAWYPSDLLAKTTQVCFVVTDRGERVFEETPNTDLEPRTPGHRH